MSQIIAVGQAEENKTGQRWKKLVGIAVTLATSLGSFGLFAIQGVLLARLLGPEQRGAFAAAGLYPQALLYLGMLGAPELFAGYASRNLEDSKLRRSASRYGLFAGCLTSLICVGLTWLTLPSDLRWVMPWAGLCALTVPLQQIRLAIQAVDHGQRQFGRYNAVRLAAAAAFPMMLCIAWLFNRTDFQSTIWLFVAAQVLSLALVQFGMNQSWIGESAVRIPTALKDARGLIGAWISAEILERVDMVLILILVANQEVLGYYAAAVPIASVMIIIPNTAGLYAFNRGARQGENLTTSEVWRFLGLGLLVQIAVAIALAVVLPYVIPLLYGQSFQPTVAFTWALLPAGVFRGLLQACDSYMRARQKPVAGVKARAIAIPVLLIFSWLAVPKLDALAVPIGLSLALGVCFAIMVRAVLLDSQEVAKLSHPSN